MSANMGENDSPAFRKSWEHVMGPLDRVLDDTRANIAMLEDPHPAIGELMERAERERAAAAHIFHELIAHRETLARALDDLQRELAVAGAPLRGEIS